jgi:hypothetical protein
MNRLVGALILVLAVVMTVALQDAHRRGLAEGRAEAVVARIDTLREVVRVTDTVYRNARRTVTETLTRWDTTVLHDTITVDSVVYVPLAPAESVVVACRRLVASCDLAIAARDTLVRALELRIATMPAPRPAWQVWAGRAGWFALGAGLVKATR